MLFQLTLTILLPTLAYSAAVGASYNVVVAQDGSGNYKTVQEAINKAPGNSRFIIYIKPGKYEELITVSKKYVTLIADDYEKVILTNHLYASMPDKDGNPIGTFSTASVFIDADEFVAENISFVNSAGQNAGQALAIRVDGDKVVFRHCRFLGWQDTILVNKGRHYFQNCYIQGHVDYIFGAATAFFDKCHIYSLAKGSAITAASTPQETTYGYVFSHCNIEGASGVQTYLGRPWRQYASVYVIYSTLSEIIQPEGWLNWEGTDYYKTARYYEYGNTGAGASLSKRVSWSHTLSQANADKLTPEYVLGFKPSEIF